MMEIPYELAGEWSAHVHALALVEHFGHVIAGPCLGACPYGSNDGGRAFGLLQMHPATFQEYYGMTMKFPASVAHTWTEAQIVAAASFFQLRIPMMGPDGLDLAVQAWNQGVTAVMKDGKRAEVYLARWSLFYQKLRAEEGK